MFGKHLKSGWTFKVQMEIWICLHLKNRKCWIHKFLQGNSWLGLRASAFLDRVSLLQFATTASCPSDTKAECQLPLTIRFALLLFWCSFDLQKHQRLQHLICLPATTYSDFTVSSCLTSMPSLRRGSRLTLSPLLWLAVSTHTRKGCLTTSGSQDYVSSTLQESFIQMACIVVLTTRRHSWLFKHFPRVDCEFVGKRDCGLSLFMSSAPLCFQ